MTYTHYLVRLTFDIEGLIAREAFELHAAGYVQAAAVAGVLLGVAISSAAMAEATMAEVAAGIPFADFRIRHIEFFRVVERGG